MQNMRKFKQKGTKETKKTQWAEWEEAAPTELEILFTWCCFYREVSPTGFSGKYNNLDFNHGWTD